MARHIDPRPAGDLRFTESNRRVRAALAGNDVADSTRPLLVWEPGRAVPLYAFPRADVRLELLSPAGELPPRAHAVSEAWQLDGRVVAWTYDDPELAGYVTLDWQPMDAWLEEDEEVFVHPRDPFHRVELRAASRHVQVEVDGTLLAESRRPLLLFETGLPTRYYLPPEDVRTDLLEPTTLRSQCPYKGEAVYCSARTGGRELAWSYPDPLPEIPRIAGLIAFFNERVDLTIDGESQQRPQTPWS